MNEQQTMKRKLNEIAFAIHELVLFLDTHTECEKALSLLESYRAMYKELLEAYEKKYGTLILTYNDPDDKTRWQWVDGPWPWENSERE